MAKREVKPEAAEVKGLLRSDPEFPLSLKTRGLHGVECVVADDSQQELRRLCDRRNLAEARQDLAAWLAKWSGKYPELTGWMEETIEETPTFYRKLSIMIILISRRRVLRPPPRHSRTQPALPCDKVSSMEEKRSDYG